MIIHDSSGFVFLIVNDNHRENVKFFNMLHTNYGTKSSLKLQRIKLFSKLNLLQAVPHNVRDCCSEPLFDSEIELLDSCFSVVHKLEVVERSSIYYISGFIAYKENIYHDDSDPAFNDSKNPNSRKLCHSILTLTSSGIV